MKEPQIFRVKSPVRVDLCGGTLDLWPIYTAFGSAKTVNCALSLAAFCDFKVDPSSSFRCDIENANGDSHHFSKTLSYSTEEALPKLEKVATGLRFPTFLVSQYLNRFSELPAIHLKIKISSDFPLRSGLGGSSALAVGLTRGMARVTGEFSEQGWQWSLLHWVKDMEAAFLRVPTGTQDYLAALFGGLNTFSSQLGGIRQSAFPDDVFNGFAERAVVLFSGEMHHSGLSNWELFKRAYDGDEKMWNGLSSIAQLADQLDSELRGHVNWKYVGQCLSDEWKVRRETFKVQTSRLDEIIEFVSSKKILGAKVCGAAQGGSLLILVDPSHRDKFISDCEAQKIQVLSARPEKAAVTIQAL